ncbi:hypothetical protein NE237_013524 [Protea cynaroides]|uniref:Uncharacterized protein n=1 Tax=Protea cynaroides TaxID=273540 RepID=A0A9Q0H146_9MAGN|nr:hypothetical protein NE237_013524 [Protea cynaroides]
MTKKRPPSFSVRYSFWLLSKLLISVLLLLCFFAFIRLHLQSRQQYSIAHALYGGASSRMQVVRILQFMFIQSLATRSPFFYGRQRSASVKVILIKQFSILFFIGKSDSYVWRWSNGCDDSL